MKSIPSFLRGYLGFISFLGILALDAGLSQAQANQNPTGYLDGVGSNNVAWGWAFDPDASSSSIDVHFYVDGSAGQSSVFVGAVTANISRPDVNDAYRIQGNHGYQFTIPTANLSIGTHYLYAYAINTPAGSNPVLMGSPKPFTVSQSVPPSILSFAASPQSITSGQATTLSWSVSNATSLSINQGVGSVSGSTGNILVAPASSMVYTLTASNGQGNQVTASTSVTVNTVPPPPTPAGGHSPKGQTLPSSTTQVNLTWPVVNGASSYKVFAYDRNAPEEVHCSSGAYYYCNDTNGTSASMSVKAGHVYQWWVKAYNSQSSLMEEKEAVFAVAPVPNTLTVRASKSYVQPGEFYYLYATKHPTSSTIADYDGQLEAQYRFCRSDDPSSCSAPSVFPWLTSVNGKTKADVSANIQLGIHKARFRPLGSADPWSNEIAIHVGTTAGLIDMTKYWTLPTNAMQYFVGNNHMYDKTYNSAIWYGPTQGCPGLSEGVLTMYFTKDKAEGYWSPKYPERIVGDGEANLKWFLTPWQKRERWHDTYLSAFGHQAVRYDAGNLLPSGNFEDILNGIRYGSEDQDFPPYVLSPQYVGLGYGMQNRKQSYRVVDGATPICALDLSGQPVSNWYVTIDKTVLHTANYEGPVARIRFHEGSFDGTTGFGGVMIREDWYFAKNIGLVRVEQKLFHPSAVPQESSLNPVVGCAADMDCVANEFMVNPQATMNFTNSAPMPPAEAQVHYNGNHAAISFTGAWTNFSPLEGAYQSDEIYTSTPSAAAVLSLPAGDRVTRLRLYAAKAFNRGKMEVYIDGVSKGIVDAYDPGVKIGQKIFDSGFMPPGAHEIKIINRSTDPNRPYIGIDKITVSKQG